MKKKSAIIFFCAASVFAGAQAQDSTKNSVSKHISNSNEKADNLQGKKIQQQILNTHSFEKLDSPAAAGKPAKKKTIKPKRKHQ